MLPPRPGQACHEVCVTTPDARVRPAHRMWERVQLATMSYRGRAGMNDLGQETDARCGLARIGSWILQRESCAQCTERSVLG